MKIKHKKPIAFGLVFLFLLGLSFFFAKHKQLGVTLGIVGFSPLLAFTLTYVACKCLNCINKRALAFAIPYSFLLVLFSELTYCYVVYGTISLTLTNAVAPLIVTPLIAVYIAGFLTFFTQTERTLKKAKVAQGKGGVLSCVSKFNNFVSNNSKKAFFILWAITLLCWLPYLLAYWPGIEGSDAKSQFSWLLKEGTTSAHHPVIHTLFMSVPMWVSNQLLGNYEAGFVAHLIAQMIITSGIFIKTIEIVNRWNLRFNINLPLWLFFTFFPVFPYYSICATKDVIFSALFSLCFVCVADVAVNKKINGRNHVASLFFLFLITALFRNNFIYSIVLFAIVLLLFGKNLCVNRLKCTCFFGAICVVYFLIVGPLYTVSGVTPIKSKEMMSVPGNQLATVAQAGDVTQEEINFISHYFPTYDKLNKKLADPVKNNFNADAVKDDPLKFVKGYIDIGLRHPKAYIDAYFRLEINYFSPVGSRLVANDASTAVHAEFEEYKNSNNPTLIEIPPNSLCPTLQKVFKKVLTGRYGFLSYVPLVSQLYQCGFWLWALLLLFVLSLFLKNKNIAIGCCLILCYWLTVVLGPEYGLRYALPLLECAPVIVAMFVYLKSHNKTLPN